MAAGDITAVRIASAAAHNGFVAEIDIDALSTGGTYALGMGANGNPSTAKVVFTVTSPGYDATGSATTIQRTVYGVPCERPTATGGVRKAYPDEATADETSGAGFVTIRIALSDFIYTGDTATVTIASGLYTQGGTPSNATTALAVTNNSTLAHPKVIGRWAWACFEAVQSNFLLEAVCVHRSALNGKPVAAVTFTVTDASMNSYSTTVTEMTVSTRSGVGNAATNKVLVYAATIPISTFNQGEVLTANFVAYPWVGDSGATLSSSAGTAPPDERLGPLKLLCDKNSTYGGGCAVVDATNGNNSTATTWVYASQSAAETAYGSATTNSYTTIGNAVQAIKSYNNTNLSRNNPGGGKVLLSGTANWPGTSPGATQGAQDTYCTITRLSSVARASAVINANSNSSLKVQRVKITDVTISGASTFQVGSQTATDVVWVHDCDINLTSTGGMTAWQLGYATNNAITAFTIGFLHVGSTKTPWALVRGNAGPTSASSAGIISHLYAVLGNYNIRPSFQRTGNAQGHQISDNAVLAFNSHYGLNDTTWLSTFTDTVITDGLGVVQNLVERAVGTGALILIAGDSVAAASNNVVLLHNTFAGERLNLGYNDLGSTAYLHKNYAQKNNVCDEWNNKDDTFITANAARTGSWPVGYNVGAAGNHKRAASSAEWKGEFMGLYTVDGGTLGFVDDASGNNGGGGDGSGNGDYHLTSSASGYSLVPAGYAVLPYDLEGTARNNTGGGSAGAFEMNPPASGTAGGGYTAWQMAVLGNASGVC